MYFKEATTLFIQTYTDRGDKAADRWEWGGEDKKQQLWSVVSREKKGSQLWGTGIKQIQRKVYDLEKNKKY